MGRRSLSLLGLAATMAIGVTAQAAFTETFDSAAAGPIGNISGWYGGTGTPPSVVAGGGVAASNGLGNATEGFNWIGHTFRWDTMNNGDSVTMGMDFQSSGTVGFNDDRIGWAINGATSVSSSNHFGVQLDDAGGTQGVKTYWKAGGGTQQVEFLNLDGVMTNNGWYRARATFTKTGSASADISVTVQALDSSGNPTGSLYSADSNTSPNGVLSAPSTLFTGELTPMYKNFNAWSGNADNAYFSGVVAVPEPATLSLLALAGLALGRRRSA